jgi:UDP-2,3-diacylglucosamine hydrolase
LSTKNIYFLSDFHLGTPNAEQSMAREKRICQFLDTIKDKASAIYLVGDLFDFWFEYATVVPKGYIRFLGKLAELKDRGVSIFVFTGNHDLWMKNYLTTELGIPVFFEPVIHELNGKSFYIAHGDGLGPGDTGYKIMKKIFANSVCRWLFKWLHPDIGVAIANYWSRKSRKAGNKKEEKSFGTNEWLAQYAASVLKHTPIHYFIFGHRHLPIEMAIENSTYINLGDWLQYDSYALFDGQQCKLCNYTTVKTD